MKRALIVGINKYKLPNANLRGCVRDAYMIANMLQRHDFDRITVLTDEEATQSNIMDELEYLLGVSRKGDDAYYYQSGHGTQIPDFSGDELDGLDECVVTHDHDWDDPFIDDKIKKMIKNMASGVWCSIMMDTCHSGTMTDAPEGARVLPMPKKMIEIIGDKKPKNSGKQFGTGGRPASKLKHLLLSGCKEGQYGYESHFGKHGWHGALSFAFYKANLGKYRAWGGTYQIACALLRKWRFGQDPVLTGKKSHIIRKVFGG